MLLLLDANVLIDFVTTDGQVLAKVVEHLGAVHVPRDVLAEVEQLDEVACAALGLVIVDGTVEQLTEAGSARGRLSFEDRVCLIIARDNGWTCVTNDGRLRRECEAVNVPVLWGFQLMIELVRRGALTADEAVAVAEAVGRANPRLTPEVVEAFRVKVRSLGRAASKP